MKTKAMAIGALAIFLAVTLTVFAEAKQSSRTVQASGILEEERVVVSVPTALAVIGADQGGRAKPGSARGQLRPVGTVASISVMPGDRVKLGQLLFTIDDRIARQNLAGSKAKFDAAVATISNLAGTRSDLASKQADLNQTEADLKRKRADAQSQFTSKYAEGQAKLAELRRTLAQVNDNLGKAKAGLAATEQAEAQARQLLAAAQSLPDTDPTKPVRIQQATALLQGVLQKQAQLRGAVRQLTAARAKLQQGLRSGEAALSAGKQQFEAGIAKIDDALAKISEGRRNIREGISTVSKKIVILQKRRDQAETGAAVAQEALNATTVTATGAGLVKDVAINEGSVLFPGQRALAIARDDTLKLNFFVPLDRVVDVKRGDSVRLSVDAAPGREFSGRVKEVGATALFAPSDIATKELELLRVVKVIVEVKNEDGILKAGMPADVTIQ